MITETAFASYLLGTANADSFMLSALFRAICDSLYSIMILGEQGLDYSANTLLRTLIEQYIILLSVTSDIRMHPWRSSSTAIPPILSMKTSTIGAARFWHASDHAENLKNTIHRFIIALHQKTAKHKNGESPLVQRFPVLCLKY